MAEIRLQKWMAQCGVASRRHSEKLIEQGQVKVNGLLVRQQGLVINPAQDEVVVSGQRLEKAEEHRYYIYFKRAGLLTTVSDPQGRPTIFDELPRFQSNVVPVGRLDADTRGLLLLTNDGELTYRLTHPSYEVPKTYIAVVYGPISNRELRLLEKGVELEDGRTAAANVMLLSRSGSKSKLRLTIREGRKRQVRRMMAAVGHPVADLIRVRFATLDCKRMSEGDVRELRPEEIKRLKSLVHLQ